MKSIFHAVAGLGAAALMGMTPLAAYADTADGPSASQRKRDEYPFA
mgnify:CR=1 FL=1